MQWGGTAAIVAGMALGALTLPWPAAAASCWLDQGALIAPAAFGAIAGDFLIDLSAGASQIHVTRAQEDGVEAPAFTRDLVAAGRRLPAFSMAVADLDARSALFAASINGVLGADVLGRFVVEIDPSPCRLRLSLQASAPPAGAMRLPVTILGGRPLVSATISDGDKVRSGLFAIDTADWASHIAGARLSRPLPAGHAAPPIRLRALEVAGRLFEQVPAVADTADGGRVQGAIGMAVWSHWRLRLDMRRGWLDLLPLKPSR